MQEYIAMQDADGVIQINTVDTNDKIHLAHNVQQYATLTDLFKVFRHRVGFNFMDPEMEPGMWDSKTTYHPNDLVLYEGKTWMALPDVLPGYAPDDVYDGEFFQTGGWAPLENKVA